MNLIKKLNGIKILNICCGLKISKGSCKRVGKCLIFILIMV